MAALPYMPLYVADYLADAAHLTAQEHGAYLLLIMTYWQRGEALPSDDKRLARIARVTNEEWSEIRETIAEFFDCSEDQWSHSRIERELLSVREKSEKARNAGRASAERRSNERSTDVEQKLNVRSTDVQRTFNHTDTDTDTDKISFSAPARFKKGTRLSEDWQPNPDLIATATSLGLSAAQFDREIAKFRDYWASRAGSQGVKLDWDATARNWMRTAAERANPPPRNSPSPTQTPAAGVWINRGSPQWQAWTKARGKEPYVSVRNGDEGAFFRSEWPQAEGVAA